MYRKPEAPPMILFCIAGRAGWDTSVELRLLIVSMRHKAVMAPKTGPLVRQHPEPQRRFGVASIQSERIGRDGLSRTGP